jgi:hypothetical protein
MPRVLVADDGPAMLCAVANELDEVEAVVSKLIPSPPIAERPS